MIDCEDITEWHVLTQTHGYHTIHDSTHEECNHINSEDILDNKCDDEMDEQMYGTTDEECDEELTKDIAVRVDNKTKTDLKTNSSESRRNDSKDINRRDTKHVLFKGSDIKSKCIKSKPNVKSIESNDKTLDINVGNGSNSGQQNIDINGKTRVGNIETQIEKLIETNEHILNETSKTTILYKALKHKSKTIDIQSEDISDDNTRQSSDSEDIVLNDEPIDGKTQDIECVGSVEAIGKTSDDKILKYKSIETNSKTSDGNNKTTNVLQIFKCPVNDCQLFYFNTIELSFHLQNVHKLSAISVQKSGSEMTQTDDNNCTTINEEEESITGHQIDVQMSDQLDGQYETITIKSEPIIDESIDSNEETINNGLNTNNDEILDNLRQRLFSLPIIDGHYCGQSGCGGNKQTAITRLSTESRHLFMILRQKYKYIQEMRNPLTKLFECPVTGCPLKSFGDIIDLNIHLKYNHNLGPIDNTVFDTPFCCTFAGCGYKCVYNSCLKRHYQSNHKQLNTNQQIALIYPTGQESASGFQFITQTLPSVQSNTSPPMATNRTQAFNKKLHQTKSSNIKSSKHLANKRLKTDGQNRQSDKISVNDLKPSLLNDNDSTDVNGIGYYCGESVCAGNELNSKTNQLLSILRLKYRKVDGMRNKSTNLFDCVINGCPNTSYEDLKAFNKHLKSHQLGPIHNEAFTDPIVCNHTDCDYRCVYDKCLNRHYETIHKGFKCNDCDFILTTKSSLTVHTKSHHSNVGLAYYCRLDECDQTFGSRCARDKHRESAHGVERPVRECHWPGCTFRSRNSLTSHIKVCHKDIRPHPCVWPDCNKRFSDKMKLQDHLNMHNKVKPHACHWPGCTFRSTLRSNINKHIKVHLK